MGDGWNKDKTTTVISRLCSKRPHKNINEVPIKMKNRGYGMTTSTPTLISRTRPEKARNKPIVECSVGNLPVKVMFDTGADLNVISEELAKKICDGNAAVRIFQSSTRVTCANGSTELCTGKVQLNVAIGPILTAHVFDIMPNIFPHMFIGLRSMKKHEIIVNAAQDCIEIQNVRLPFVSKTIAAPSLN